MKTKRLLATAVLSATAILSSTHVFANTATVAVSQIVEHPALDATRQGLLDGLKAKGMKRVKT